MSDFWLYLKLGFDHVLNWHAYDHVLFLIVLVAAYSFFSWKKVLVLVSLFTFGHTVSLLLANYSTVPISSKWIEFLIPITILIVAVYNIITVKKYCKEKKPGLLYIITVFFGLIHGAGFAAHYKMINDGNEILPLLEFALGIELAQIIIVFVILTISFVFERVFRINKRDLIIVISSIAIGVVLPMLQKNWPF